MPDEIVVLGVGNVLEKDDGIGVYAAAYLEANYTFNCPVKIINGGVEGINLLNVFLEHDPIVILDTLLLEDDPGSIYNIPSFELEGMGLNSGGAHEIGVLQCLSMIELLGKTAPASNVIGIIPDSITFGIELSERLTTAFDAFIAALLADLKNKGADPQKKPEQVPLEAIIERFRNPSGTL